MSSKNFEIHANNTTAGIIAQCKNLKVGDIYINSESKAREYIEDFRLPNLNKAFKGREQEFQNLHSLFFEKKVKKIVISGIPGYGKSELAKQFARKCQQTNTIDKILWIKAENPEDLEKISGKLHCIYDHFIQHKLLFIFDNCISRKSISKYEPPDKDNYYMLITSRTKNWHNDIQTFEIKNLSSRAALELYKDIMGEMFLQEDYHHYKKLAHIVNNVPLGVHVTGAYINQQMRRNGIHFSLQNYVDEVNLNHEVYMDTKIPDSVPNEYEQSLHEAVYMSIKKISDENNTEQRELAIACLFICSFLNPDNIHFDDLLKMPHVDQIIKQYNKNENLLRDALWLVDNFLLIKFDVNDGNISIHRFIQEILRFHLSKHDPNMKSICYSSCLECFNDISYDIPQFLRRSEFNNIFDNRLWIIFNYADDNASCLNNFFNKYQNSTNFLYKQILPLLIYFNCTESIKLIFKNLKKNDTYLNRIKFRLNHGYWDRKCNFYITKYELMHEAAQWNNTAVLEFFRSHHNVDINIRNKFKQTPLHEAVFNCNFKSIKFLIEHGANLNAKDDFGDTPLFKFFSNTQDMNLNKDELNKILRLLKFQKNVKIKNDVGASLLHASALACRVDLIKMLISWYRLSINAGKPNNGG